MTRKRLFTYACICAAIEEELELEKKQYEKTGDKVHIERMQTLKHNYKLYAAIIQQETSADKLQQSVLSIGKGE